MFDVLAVVYAGRSVNHAINEGALAKRAGNRTQQSTARVNFIQRSAGGCTFCAFACKTVHAIPLAQLRTNLRASLDC